MTAFTELEVAAIRSIFGETPELASQLEHQLQAATVSKRENSGGGFFTTIGVPVEVPAVESASVLGCETHARLAGLEHPLGFVLFMEKGRLHKLEGFAYGDDTSSLDLADLTFEVFRGDVTRSA